MHRSLIQMCRHESIDRENWDRHGLLFACIPRMQKCSPYIELRNEACYKRRERYVPRQGSKGKDCHRKNCWVWIKWKVLLAVAMKIQNESYGPLLAHLLNEIFYGGDLWTGQLSLSNIPFPIEVFAWKIGSVVPEYYSVNIHHRYHIYHIIF